MNDEPDLKRYLRKCINTVIREFSTPEEERTEDTFHDLRVEIKKIRALYSLIKFCDKSFHKKKYFEAFKTVFNKAGEVRKLQIEEQLLHKFELQNDEQLVSILHKKQKKALKEFEKVPGHHTQKKINKTGGEVESYVKKISERDLSKYTDNALKEINTLLKNPLTKDNVHKTRIRLKEFLYNLKMTIDSHPVVKKIDHLQDLIGKWHDNDSSSGRLSKLISSFDEDNKTTQGRLKRIINLLSTKNTTLLKKINVERRELSKKLKAKI